MFEVARNLALKRDLGVLPILIRGRGKPQKSLQYEQRLRNIRGTLTVRRGARKLPSRVVLIDDIFTTGATVEECARVLKNRGVDKVYALTLAID
jgi:predicted amidophosphoribosyltransferase